MKYKIVLLIILFPVFATAQMRQSAKKMVDSVVNSTLGIGTQQLDIRDYNQFKDKFAVTAFVVNNFNVIFKKDSKSDSGKYVLDSKELPFDIYAHDVALKIKNIKFKDTAVIVLTDSADSRNMKFKVTRKISFDEPRKYLVENNSAYVDSVIEHKKANKTFETYYKNDEKDDSKNLRDRFIRKLDLAGNDTFHFTIKETLLITVAYFSEDSIKITGIKNDPDAAPPIVDPLSIDNNDKDRDVILDNVDKNSNIAGDFTAYGILDSDLDGMPDSTDKCKFVYVTDTSLNHGCPVEYFITNSSLEGFIGLQLNNAKINLPELNELGYVDNAGNNLVDVLQSEKGTLKNPGQVTGVTLGISYAYYFGKAKKQLGISAGISYAAFKADYQLSSKIVYTFKANDGSSDYRRQLKIDTLNEKITYNIFNFPLMFNYRHKWGKYFNNAINLKAGPSLMLFKNTSDYNAYASIGGIYQTGNGSVIYDNFFDANAISNVFITADSINYQNSNPGADDVFNQLRANADNYDFVNNKNYRGKQKNLTRATVAVNAAIDAQFGKKDAPIVFKIGLNFIYASLPARSEKYKPLDRTTDTFQSVYNSNAKSSYSAFGFNFGFVWNF